MMKPVIGVMPLYDDEKKSYWMLPGYMKAIEKCAGLPIMSPLSEDEAELGQAFNMCDGILFTGGHDVSPSVYGEHIKETCGTICPTRDRMEGIILDLCLEKDKPFLGICRGIQFINAYLGGSLYQDLPSEYDSTVDHHMEPPYDQSAHEVEIFKDSCLAGIIGEGIHEVNSYHHQAVKELSDKVMSSAVSEDGLVEAIEIPDKKFAVAVQWHPEFSYENNTDSVELMTAFVEACR